MICTRCEKAPRAECSYIEYMAHCECYDGAPDGCRTVGLGPTRDAAIEDWRVWRWEVDGVPVMSADELRVSREVYGEYTEMTDEPLDFDEWLAAREAQP